jgi:hypothetical protein
MNNYAGLMADDLPHNPITIYAKARYLNDAIDVEGWMRVSEAMETEVSGLAVRFLALPQSLRRNA